MNPQVIIVGESLFPLGQIVATPGALDLCAELRFDLSLLFARHARGDWGDLDDFDQEQNRMGLARGLRLLSAYTIGADKDEHRIWVITEADRRTTTALLPSEY